MLSQNLSVSSRALLHPPLSSSSLQSQFDVFPVMALSSTVLQYLSFHNHAADLLPFFLSHRKHHRPDTPIWRKPLFWYIYSTVYFSDRFSKTLMLKFNTWLVPQAMSQRPVKCLRLRLLGVVCFSVSWLGCGVCTMPWWNFLWRGLLHPCLPAPYRVS